MLFLTAGDNSIYGLLLDSNQPHCWRNDFYVEMGVPQPMEGDAATQRLLKRQYLQLHIGCQRDYGCSGSDGGRTGRGSAVTAEKNDLVVIDDSPGGFGGIGIFNTHKYGYIIQIGGIPSRSIMQGWRYEFDGCWGFFNSFMVSINVS